MTDARTKSIAAAIADVKQILEDVRPSSAPRTDVKVTAGARPTPWLYTCQGAIGNLQCSDVYQNLLLGQGTFAQDIKKLQDFGVTHVVNTAMGNKFTQINTNEEFYEPFKIKFHGFEAMDVMTYKINKYFHETADFIDEALTSGGKVFVHCHQGRSRSASIVLSYLMLKQGMSVQEAFTTVRRKREVTPNDGFIRQLCELNWELYGSESNPGGSESNQDGSESNPDGSESNRDGEKTCEEEQMEEPLAERVAAE